MRKTIPRELGEIFELIKKDVSLLQIHLDIYKQLFRSQERIDIMNQCGPEIFYCFQVSLETEMVMLLSRITDYSGNKGKETLSFEHFHTLIGRLGHRDLAKKLRNTIKSIRKIRDQIRQHRDKFWAHRDLKTVMNEGPKLDPITLRMVEEAMEHFLEYMRTFEQHYDPEADFIYDTDLFIKTAGGHLFYILQNGLRYLQPGGQAIQGSSADGSKGASKVSS